MDAFSSTGSQHSGQRAAQFGPSTPVRKATNPPPICFKCSGEHFLKDCPQAVPQAPVGSGAGAARATAIPASGAGCNSPSQRVNEKGTLVTCYPISQTAPIKDSRPSLPMPSSHVGNSNNGFAPSPAPIHQFPGPAPPQAYPQQAGPPQPYPSYPPSQQYGPPAMSYAYNQQQQPYNPPPVAQPYVRPGYQAPHFNQYPSPTAPPQYPGPGYQGPTQQYGPPVPVAAPYQQPSSPYPPQNTGYTASPASYQPPPPQWNNTPQPSQPQFQRPPLQRSNSGYSRDYSVTPSKQSQRRPSQQSQQLEYASDGAQEVQQMQQTPQTPASTHSNTQQAQQQATQSSRSSTVNVVPQSKASSRASTPYGQHGSTASLTPREAKAETATSTAKDQEDPTILEEGEASESDDAEEEFNWELNHIFKEPARAEWVALAQPLSASFKSTPVPLIQAWSTQVPSISRYARKDNLKEFVRTIRSSPQWSYLQEDPAFTDAKLEGPLIPLCDVGEWMEARHAANATPEPEPLEPSRKRARSEEEEGEVEDEQDDVDHQIILESSGDEPPSKRVKNEDMEEQSDERMGTPAALMTPTLGRSGTPCLATADDAWAPSPGEIAVGEVDSTEAFLASLGVSGSPKPVKKQEALPPYLNQNEGQHQSPQSGSSQTPLSGLPTTNPTPPNPQQRNGPPPMNNAYANAPPSQPQYGPPTNAPYANGPPMSGPPMNGPPINGPQGPPQYGPPANAAAGHAHYGPAVNPPYSAPANVPYNNPQYGPPVNSYGPPNPNVNPQYAPPQTQPYSGPAPYNGPQGPPQWGQPTPAPYGNPQYPPQYGPPANPPYGNGPPVNYQQTLPQGAPQYGPPRNNSWGNGAPVPGPYGAAQYEPPQNGPYGANTPQQYGNGPGPYPNALQQYGNGQPGPYANGQQGNFPYPNGQPSQPLNGYAPNGNVPPRQDSGYVSARGSYSNGSGPADFNNQNGPQNPQTPQNLQFAQNPQHSQNSQNPQNAAPQPPQNDETRKPDQSNGISEADTSQMQLNERRNSGDTDSSLSALEAELLGGKFDSTKPKRKASSGEGSERRKSVKKPTRPQPVVAEAYSRRW